MRRLVGLFVFVVVVLAACSSDKKQVTAGTTTPTATATTKPTAPSTSAPATTTTTPAGAPSTAAVTTAPGCPNTGTTAPKTTTDAQPAALLTKVAVTTAGCRDSVTFTYRKNGAAVPSCRVRYQPGPFTHDGSGAPVKIAGRAFVVVRCAPAYGYDFAAGGGPTYTGSKRIAGKGAVHVREVVQTGDFEGVMTWVIGLDSPRAFSLTAGGTPQRILAVTFS